MVYYAEQEKDFLKWEQNDNKGSDIEEVLYEIISLFVNDENAEAWKSHCGLNFDKNINFMPLKQAS